MQRVVVFSGPIAVGKSVVISELEKKFRVMRVSTRLLIQARRDVPSEREPLQQAGDELDEETDGSWVADELAALVAGIVSDTVVVLDSVRIEKQVKHLRDRFGSKIWHVHLSASCHELQKRFELRKQSGDPAVREFATYDEARRNATEAGIEQLGKIADEKIDTDCLEASVVAMRAVEKANLTASPFEQLVDVVVGGQYGSEGKGNICDYLAKDYQVLVRVGGPNAGHKVAAPKYDYIHMPSGTGGNPETTILIGAGATLNVVRVLKEIYDWKLDGQRLSIDPQAVVIEQSDREYEAKIAETIGSTQKGVGTATARKIIGRDHEIHLGARVRLARDVLELKPFVRSVTTELQKAYAQGKKILLEGTQGTDLSIHHGLYPSVTSRETTASGCLADAGISPRRVRKIFMVTRTYPIRVGGNSGDMGIEIDYETIAKRSGLSVEEIRTTEVGTVSGKQRRIAEFSWDRVNRAAQLNGATDLVLTFADYISKQNRLATKFSELTPPTKKMILDLEVMTGATVALVSVGFGRNKIVDVRSKI